jgi:hypothetical protein
MTKDEAQRRSSDPDSAGRWTFYEAVKLGGGEMFSRTVLTLVAVPAVYGLGKGWRSKE